jgi:predicted nucleic acid-binding protein
MSRVFADTSYYIALMEQQELADALSTDHHFEQAGFRILLR